MARREWLAVHPDARAVQLAAAQRGVVDREQLTIVGLSRGAIDHRLRVGRLHRVHRGVFAVGRPDLGPLGAETAALLACGKGAVLGGHHAAALWGFGPPAHGPVEIVTPTNAGRAQAGITTRRITLAPQDVRAHKGLAVTSPARTLLSLADVVSASQLENLTSTASRMKLTTESELRAITGGRRGTRALRQVLERDPAFTRSEAERRFLQLIRKSGLPHPSVNVRLARHEVDFAWLENRLVVEVDGYAFHATRAEVEHDRRREADLDRAGFEVVRITWRQITREPEQLLVRLARRLSA